MNRLILALALLLASTLAASPAGQKVSPVEVKSCGAGTFFDQLAGTGLWHCGTPPATPPAGGNYAIQYSSGGAFAGAVITGLVLGRGAVNPPTAYGGTSGAAHEWITALDAAGVGTFARPACADLSDAGAACSSAGTSPGGLTGSFQYNNAGSFGGVQMTGLALGNGAAAPSAYAGASCVDQFPRSQNASGAWACATVANTDLASSSVILNAGVSVGLTAPGAMSLGGTYTFGATTDQPQFAGLGLGGAATGANRISIFGATSGRIELKVPAAAGTNAITFPAGTTDFSSTGGTSQFVKQASAGSALTVVRPACADLSDAAAGCSAAVPTVKGVAAIGWIATSSPDKTIVFTASSTMTITAVRGTVDTVVGATATIQPYKTASGTACSGGTALTTGTFDANGTALTNQTLTLAGAGAPSMSVGDRICLSTANGANFTAGTGNGGLTFEYTVP